MILRGPHTLDIPVSGRARRCAIQNWMHWREPGFTDWQTTDPDPDPTDNTIPGFAVFSRKGPLQPALGLDGNDRPRARMRRANDPDAWWEWVWLGTGPSVSVDQSERNARRTIFRNAWAGSTHLGYTLGRRRLDKVIRLDAPGSHPSSFRFAVRAAPGHSVALEGQSIVLRNSLGSVRLRTLAPTGWDSSQLAIITGLGAQSSAKPIRVSIAQAGTTPGGDPIFELTPHPDDLAGATYPAFLDPTSTISGDDDTGGSIEDTTMWWAGGAAAYNNYAQNTDLGVTAGNTGGATDWWRAITRIKTASIPAGTITGFRANLQRAAHGSSAGNNTLECYRIKTVDQDWVEGNASGTPETGSPCYAYRKYHASTPTNWTAGAGLGAPGGGSLYATAWTKAYAAYTSGPVVVFQVTLDPLWVEAWKTAGDNAGMHWRATDQTTTNRLFFSRGAEDGTNPPTYEIDYDAASSAKYYLDLLQRVRR